MGEVRFTMGEWIIFYPHKLDLNEGYVSVESEDGRLVHLKKTYKRTLEEDTANANLIAAAPEMYAMLEFLVNNDSINDHSIDKEVQALLAKARGEG